MGGKKFGGIFLAALIFIFFGISDVSAHQPNIVGGGQVLINDPEISRAFYDELLGAPKTYVIQSDKEFELYLNLLVPKNTNPDGRYSAKVYRAARGRELIGMLDGAKAEWKEFYEPFGGDYYFTGPEFDQKVSAGQYEVEVYSADNRGKYALAVGKIESFTASETAKVFMILPKLKTEFFNDSPFAFAATPFGAAFLVIFLVLGLIFGKVYHLATRKWFSKSLHPGSGKNIGRSDRILRFAAGLALLIAGMYFWSAIIIFLAGFVFYEAFSGWCGLYAIMGKNTCPINN